MLSTNVVYVMMAFIVSAVLAMIVIPRLLVIAKEHSLYDVHDKRKTHVGAVPRIGGVSFVPGILLSMMLTFSMFFIYADSHTSQTLYPTIPYFFLFICGLLLLYLGGIKDDLVGMEYHYKFMIQVIASVFVVCSGLQINNLFGLFGIYELSPWIGMPLTVLALVFIINAMNLIDGMDGLASGISIFALSIYGMLFLTHGLWVYAVLAYSTVGVLAPFFYYNVFGQAQHGSKLFMGDSGSLTLGLILGYLAIRYLSVEQGFYNVEHSTLVVALSPLLLPALDVLRVILYRARHGKGLFEADRSHIYHKLLDMGLSSSIALIFLVSGAITFCFMNFVLMRFMGAMYVFLTDIILWSALNIYISRKTKKKRGIVSG